MIKSVISDYSEMVRLIPVTRNNSNFLIPELKGIIKDLENVGFSVVCLTSDNASINRTTFESLCLPGETFFMSETFPNKRIYTFFDAPHMIKSIRNNWINCKDKIFYYPNFNDHTKIQKADFSILEDVYNMEK